MALTIVTVIIAWTAASMFATALWALAAGGTRQTETRLLTGWWSATVARPTGRGRSDHRR